MPRLASHNRSSAWGLFRPTTMCAALVACVLLVSPGDELRAQEAGWSVASPAFVAVSVMDFETSTEWYSTLFDLEVVREIEARDGSASVRILRGGDVVIELIAHSEPIGIAPEHADEAAFRFAGLFKTGVFVEGIEAMHADLLSRGTQVDARIGVDEVLGMRTFVFRDPDGNRLQAFERCSDGCGGE